ncbi:unnamed protein product, partial [Closterium sp. Naga37s-1]
PPNTRPYSPSPHLLSLTSPSNPPAPAFPYWSRPTGGAIVARPASNAFRADPGLLFIGTDLDVEPWTRVACNFECGPALDSALQHMESATHRAQLLAKAHKKAPKEPFLTWSYPAFLKEGGFEAFLKQLKSTSRA